IETFANSLGRSVEEFAKQALESSAPADLGTRCTVFMNSKVKQSLREGAGVEDIAAGLAYSVIKNCLHKVLKIKDRSVLGDTVVVQGGTFKNPAIHRAFEKILGTKAVCPHVPELMGAYGAALLARDANIEKSNFIGTDNLSMATGYDARHIRCKGCENKCTVTKMTFSNGRIFHSGNKCERIFSNEGKSSRKGFNLPDYKLELLFNRPLKPKRTPIAKIGVPRALNMFENFPFWATLLVKSGFEVILSPESTAKVYEAGARTVMSDNICYPAKLTHGHVLKLVEMGVDRIFFPTVVKEADEFQKALNTFNCPVVTGYPDVIRSALAIEESKNIPFDVPVVSFANEKLLKQSCWKYLSRFEIPKNRFEKAFKFALEAQRVYRSEVLERGKRILEDAAKRDEAAVLLLGRPYHVDRQVNHKIPEMISNMGAHVLTEDSVSGGDIDLTDVHVLTQWEYANRIYAACKAAKGYEKLHIVQLNSFGCGPDAIAVDEAKEILESLGKSHTLLKIDEVSSPGSNKLRLRSMMESVKLRGERGKKRAKKRQSTPPFLDVDRDRKVLAPFFSPFHSPIIEAFSRHMGYDMETLPPPDRQSVEVGLKYTNNEICYPAVIVIGDLIKAVQSGKYDSSKLALGITQTGGQCRASSYLSLLKKALLSAGYGDIPVVTVALVRNDLNYQPGFGLDMGMVLKRGLHGLLYSDAIMQMYYPIAAREMNRGDAKRIADKYMDMSYDLLGGPNKGFLKAVSSAAREFNAVPLKEENVPVVGFVGEIYVKYNSFGNLFIVDYLTEMGVEVLVPPMFDFFIQLVVNTRVDVRDNVKKRGIGWAMTYPAEWYIRKHIARFEEAKSGFRYYRPAHDFQHIANRAEEIIHLTNQFGEGWLIPGEVASMAEDEVNNVLCVQPFGCIANHIIGKGIEKRLKDMYPSLNLLT
ncbi:MAG TPA: CoA activase, partial [Euryarchaeota archaeon]|nr:CoA activase [Euryarchaeota archaeon]